MPGLLFKSFFSRYLIMHRKILSTAGATVMLVIFTACSSTGQPTIYDNVFYYSGNSENTDVSSESIDRERTYELFLAIEGESDCVKISFESETPPHPVTGKTQKINIFFEIDKKIDISPFKKKQNYTFSSFARNYDNEWSHSPSAEICSTDLKPIAPLHEGTILRVRFTLFRYDNFSYELIVEADSRITIMEHLPEK